MAPIFKKCPKIVFCNCPNISDLIFLVQFFGDLQSLASGLDFWQVAHSGGVCFNVKVENFEYVT